MKIKLAKIIGESIANTGVIAWRWQGESCFALIGADNTRKSIGERVSLGGLQLRVVAQVLSDNRGFYKDTVLVMKDSLIARLIARYYSFLCRFLPKLLEFEIKYYLVTVKEGEELPNTSLTKLLGRTFPII